MNPILRKIYWSLGIVLFTVTGCYNDNEEDLYPENAGCDTTRVTYSQTVAPIMQRSCNVCHSTAVASGNVITDNYEGVSAIARDGRLWGTISWTLPIKMPQDAAQLPPCDLNKINIWIRNGAKNN